MDKSATVASVIKSIIQDYKTTDNDEKKIDAVLRLRNTVFSPSLGPNANIPSLGPNDGFIRFVRDQFHNIWSSQYFKETGECQIGDVDALMESTRVMLEEIETRSTPRHVVPECPSCKSKTYFKGKVSETLYEIITCCVESLSGNVMESSIGPIIAEMMDKIMEFLSDEQKKEESKVISAISIMLEDHGWEGNGFYSAPNRVHLRKLLSDIIKIG